jgi:hypothetical protein
MDKEPFPDLDREASFEKIKPQVELKLFDWSQERRNSVIVQSQTKLEKFLEGDELKDTIKNLWEEVIKAFKNGGEVGGKKFEKNLLPAHSHYHIAKMLTLAVELFEELPEQYLSEKYKTRENRLAVCLAAIFHDLGQLKQSTDDPDLPQQAYYPSHEKRGIDLAEQILETFSLSEGLSDMNKERLLKKIKVLIYGTQVAKDMVFGDNPNPTWEQTAIYKEINNGEIRINDETVINLETDAEKEEYLALMRLFATADHGSYLLEPAKLVEILGLWQEQMRLWIAKNGTINPSQPPNARYLPRFLLSNYPILQESIYGELLKKLKGNPFFKNASIDHFLQAQREIFKQSQTVSFDPLVRFEGFFNPHQLLELHQKFKESIEDPRVRLEIEDAIIKFSENFQSFQSSENFSGLVTPILAKIYQNLPKESDDKRLEFIQKAIAEIISESKTALGENGKINLHIAPYAYGEALETFVGRLAVAAQSFPQIERVYLTYRQDKEDDLQAMIAAIDSSITKNKLGLAIGGKPGDLEEVFKTISNANIAILVHFGLEETKDLMETRIDEFLQFLENHPDQKQNFSLQIDSHFDWFLEKFNRLNETQQEMIRDIVKSASPLYLLLSQKTEAEYKAARDQLSQFLGVFPGTCSATNNACMLGDLGVIGQNFALMAAKD